MAASTQLSSLIVLLLSCRPEPIAADNCDESEYWYENDGSCFYISAADGDAYSFQEAVSLCQSMGCTLASVLNQSQNNFFAWIIGDTDYWLGLVTVDDYDASENNISKRREGWRWLDGSYYSLHGAWTNWYDSPANATHSEPQKDDKCSCIHYEEDTWTWKGVNCPISQFPVICKKNLGAEAVTAMTTEAVTAITTSVDAGSSGIPMSGVFGAVGAAFLLLLLIVGLFVLVRRKWSQPTKSEPPECPYVDFARTSPTTPAASSSENIVEQIVSLNRKTRAENRQSQPDLFPVKATDSSSISADYTADPQTMRTPFGSSKLDLRNSTTENDLVSSQAGKDNFYDNAGFVNGQPPAAYL